jgi:hypothetical protein
MQCLQNAYHLTAHRIFFKVGLPTVALASMLGTAPGFAANQIFNQTTSGSEPVMVANIFDNLRTLGESIEIINDVIQGGQAPRNRTQTRPQTPQSGQQIRTEIRQQPLGNPRQQSGDFANEIQRRRAEDAARREAHRQRREEYLQSLTPEEQEAFLRAEQEHNSAIWRTILQGGAIMESQNSSAPSRPQSCVIRLKNGSETITNYGC